jgi:hypothetical protein
VKCALCFIIPFASRVRTPSVIVPCVRIPDKIDDDQSQTPVPMCIC